MLSEPHLQALFNLVPTSARRVLDIGCGDGGLGAAIEARQAAEVIGIESSARAAEAAKGRLDHVLIGYVDEIEADFAESPFDCVLCRALLPCLREPDRHLRRVRSWLAEGGAWIGYAPNVRRHAVIAGLLEGTWEGVSDASLPEPPLRFFTRREIEKLFVRSGFALPTMTAVDGPDLTAWRRQGRPGQVQVGPLHIAGLDPTEAEEFYAERYLIHAAAAPAPDYGFTSIVILTHNQLAYTRLCLDSIRRFTDEPYEVIVVDNASTDGTPEYLQSLQGVTLLRNSSNRGFPAACNQGLEVAQGRQVLLLNNDTVVTTGWLRRMLQALASDPSVGLVGPCSNQVSGEQRISVGYDDDLVGLDGFAWEWGKAHDRRREDTDRLVGFCLLIRREVMERIGFLDERFGLGCFEDDDYCLRAVQAGFRAVIARDCFVHHFGGRTFTGSGVDFAGLMRRNQGLFDDKWRPGTPGNSPAASPVPEPVSQRGFGPFSLRRAPGGGLLLTPRAVHLSLCMIVRDNAKTLEACLTSIRPWVDEMCVVDTGSVDETPEIAARLGARVFHFPWCDSFSAARNESLRHARGRWIFWMDSDDVISPENGRKLQALIDPDPDPGVLGFVMQVHCPGSGPDGHLDMTVVDHIKLFRNLPHLQFEGRLHEQILPAIRRAGGETAWTEVFVLHAGYDHSPEGQERKKQRDLKLLHLEWNEQPEHPFTLFNLGMTYADIGECERAVEFLVRSIRHSGAGESHLRKVYALLTFCHGQLRRPEQAWETCERGLFLFPEDVELRFRRAVLLHEAGRLQESAAGYLAILQAPVERYFTSLDRGIVGYKARQNLALVYADQGDLARSEEQWRLVVQDAPRFRPGWRGLGEVLLRRGKHTEAVALAERMLTEESLRPDGLLLRVRAAVATGDLVQAKHRLKEAATAMPDDADTLEICCRFLFEHGEAGEAEAALKDLLRLRPEDAAAHHNLGTVYVRQGRALTGVEAYRRSLQLRPESAATWFLLGEALRDAGRLREAADAWGQAARLDPGNPKAEDALRRARQATVP